MSLAASQTPKSVPYNWKNVQMVGAGFVDGIVFHPTAKDVRYARTDMGGAYRWDAGRRRWAPILDWVPFNDLNFMGVESIAVDPANPRNVYLACGTYTNSGTPNGAILRSRDGGRTFSTTRVPFKFGGNENGRGNGERMTVDPNDPRRLLLGTRHDGLWRSDDGAVTWHRLESFTPLGGPRGAGVVVTLFDPNSGSRGKGSRTAYVAVSNATGPNLFVTTDDGATWAPVPNAPTGLYPTHMVRGGDGALWLTYGSNPGPQGMTDGAVWKYKGGAWSDVTPEKGRFGYGAVSVQMGRPDTVIVSTFFHPPHEQIFRTTDGGKSWRPTIGGKETFDYSKAPYISRTGIHWLFDIEINPRNPDHAIFTTGYGGHETFNLTDADRGKPVIWHAMATGIEESVGLELLSPTQGVPLVTAIGDYGGFVHRDLDKPAPEGNFTNPHFGNTTGVAAGDLAPLTIVRVGSASGGNRGNIGYSIDGGKSWNPTKSAPTGAREGHIAVSADGKTWVWSLRNGAFRTSDRGDTWAPVALPAGLRVIADHVDSSRFYALDLFGGKLFTSSDGGATFVEKSFTLAGGLPRRGGDRMDARAGQDQLYATPGRTGDLWIAAFDGLHHSVDGGTTFMRMGHIRELHAFGFGKAAPHSKLPAMYVVGSVDGRRGIFRSDDGAASWARINDDDHQWGLVLQIAGDPKRYGRVYVGTHGRGVFYGDPR
ncbi:Cellulase [Fimbriimonas ginsengisoli Gsoil 348]|uniref:Cellulase n=1 Tax=Fimbriimonas ginsengisoli Gsoil 348 TaxID=661478 RepID=A0A068NSW3_FIMGI|nr:Cellulase [Fimbriimonas ginsengisoli Gsoil 348]